MNIATEIDLPFDFVLAHLLRYRSAQVEMQLSAETWEDFQAAAIKSEAVSDIIRRMMYDANERQQQMLNEILQQHRQKTLDAQAAHETWLDVVTGLPTKGPA